MLVDEAEADGTPVEVVPAPPAIDWSVDSGDRLRRALQQS
jgi:hypothetical protein